MRRTSALWERFLPACLDELQKTYDRLDVTFDHTLGESFYHDRLAGGRRRPQGERPRHAESDGAQCVFLEGHDAPFIVQKKDGAFLYSTTDLATIRYRRWRSGSPDAMLYVVDHRQSLHFEQLFSTAKLWGYDELELTHVAFGTVLGEDGKPLQDPQRLGGRPDGAPGRGGRTRRCAIAAEEPGAQTDEERREVAERIGIGAIKYADLAHNRTSDYVVQLRQDARDAAAIRPRICSTAWRG